MNDFIDHLKKEPLPALGRDFNAGVWQQIDERRRREAALWWSFWPASRLAFVGTTLAVSLGIGAGFVNSRPALANRDALHLDVFDAEARYMTSGLLARAQ